MCSQVQNKQKFFLYFIKATPITNPTKELDTLQQQYDLKTQQCRPEFSAIVRSSKVEPDNPHSSSLQWQV